MIVHRQLWWIVNFVFLCSRKDAHRRIVRSREDAWRLFKLDNQIWVVKKLTIFLAWLVANNKTIHSPTSRHRYFYSLEFFKNFDYCYHLLTIYTEFQINTVRINSRYSIQSRPSVMSLMSFTFKKNNELTRKPVNCFLQDGASARMRSLQTSIVIKLCQTLWNGSPFHGPWQNFFIIGSCNHLMRITSK